MQSGCGLQQKRPSSLFFVWGSGYCSSYPLHPQFHCEYILERAVGRAARRRASPVRLHLDSKSWESLSWYLCKWHKHCHKIIFDLNIYSACLTGNNNVFMGLYTRRRTRCDCDNVCRFLLSPAFPIKIFCRVSVTNAIGTHTQTN